MLENMTNVLANFVNDQTYTCGGEDFTFEGIFPQVVSVVVTVIKIGIPILLIILGMIDLGKAVVAQKEDEIKKGQSLFIRRLISALLVFLVVFIVQLVVRFVASGENADISQCINCFVSGKHTDAKITVGTKAAEDAEGCYMVDKSKTIEEN